MRQKEKWLQEKQEEKEKEEYEREMQLQADINSKGIHRPGKKLDQVKFENSYKRQVEQWVRRRNKKEDLSQTQVFEKPKISKASKKIVNGQFQNLGNKHNLQNVK